MTTASALPTRDLLRRVTDDLMTLPYEAWNFGDSVAFEGLLAAGEALDDPAPLAFVRGFARAWATRVPPFRRLDCTAAGLAMVEVVRRTGDDILRERLVQLAEYLVARPLIGPLFATWEHSPLMEPFGPDRLPPDEAALLADPPPGAFIDCLHFDPPFLTALGRTAGRPDLVAAGVGQALGYVEVLQAADGSFDHFVLEGDDRTYGPLWGRGQGWALLGLLDVLAEIGPDHPDAPALGAATRRGIAAMLRTQRPDGHWDAVIGDAASDVETSAAAFMAAAFRRAVRLGVVTDAAEDGVSRAAVEAAAARAHAAMLAATAPDGALGGVSVAVMACTTASHYAHVSRGHHVPWGQGPLALALVEGLRTEDAPGA